MTSPFIEEDKKAFLSFGIYLNKVSQTRGAYCLR